jgi:small GTP-binding protein
MNETFSYDVFLSHSSKDKAVVREVAELLRQDGLKVWFDEWEIKASDSIPAKIEEGLDLSRVLVLCMSANAFGSDWAQLESGTFRFLDPLNKERRFIPLRLDDTPIKGSLAQFLYINWLPLVREKEYPKLLEACRPSLIIIKTRTAVLGAKDEAEHIQLGRENEKFSAYAFNPNGNQVLTGGADNPMRLWSMETGEVLRVFEGAGRQINCLAWSADQRRALAGANDGSLRLWDVTKGNCLKEVTLPRLDENYGNEHNRIDCIAWSHDQRRVLFGGGMDQAFRLWDVGIDRPPPEVIWARSGGVASIALSSDKSLALVGHVGLQEYLSLWDLEKGEKLKGLAGHSDAVRALAWFNDNIHALSGSSDNTIRLWDTKSGKCLHIFEGHWTGISDLAWTANHSLFLSGSEDGTVRLWDLETRRCLLELTAHNGVVRTVAWSADGQRAFSGDSNGCIRVWDFSEFINETRSERIAMPSLDQIQYTNAKVLLVGESGAGKTGLSKRLALNDWQPSDSTVGAWATQWKLPVSGGKGVEREIWLWDFGGQADQRLIHQLYMDETALAVLVFDGQREDLFEMLGQWDRDLTRATRKEFAKLLVAGRVDAGGLRVSRSEVEKFAAERKFRGFLETSAKTGFRCEELNQAILDAIPWDELPCRTTKVLFKRLKEEIIALKDEGRVLMRFNELRETLQLRFFGELAPFTDAELRAVLTLLAGPGVVWELEFGSWVLLQPERINAYAQAVIRTLQADEHQRGCLMEERVLKGDLMYESSMERLQGDEERFVLLAVHQTLVERGLCLRQPTMRGNLLVFPSYYRKERPDIVQYPAVQVNYRFTGFLDELYATLVVRLHHSDAFEQDDLWRYAADFKTNAGKQLGIKLTRRAPGAGDLEVYFDAAVSVEEKIIFSKYVHEHLLQHARDVERLRHYVCPECGTPVGNREVAMKRLNEWLKGRPPQPEATGFKLPKKKEETPTIICVGCEKRVPLWDEMEQCFASPEIQQRVRDMQEEANVELDNESKERALVGEVISTVALAAQISREKNVSDHGIDMEIEFKDDNHEATHRFIFLQLKSGDSYTRKRKKDGTEVFTIKDERHARYWMASPFPVLLVIRNSEGEVRWMEVRDYLKRETDNGKKAVKQIVFTGERFDVMSVRRWREKMLGGQ